MHDVAPHRGPPTLSGFADEPPKFARVARLLERRIRHGDYLLKPFPTDRQLSSEFGVDPRTARRAVTDLIELGLVIRSSNGRPVVVTGAGTLSQADAADVSGTVHVAMLHVAYPSPYTWRWLRTISRQVKAVGGVFRPVAFTHVDDAVVGDTLANFDATFMLLGDDATPHLLRLANQARGPVVFLDADVSGHGLPSLWLTPPERITLLLDHLDACGYRRVACLNTQPENTIITRRLAAWDAWCTRDGTDRRGRLVYHPVHAFDSAVEAAFRHALHVIDDGGFAADAVVCLTSTAAKGLYRAMHERGLTPGRDLGVCSADDGAGEAPFLVPSLTSLADPDPDPSVVRCLEWFASRSGTSAADPTPWDCGRLLREPGGGGVFEGESTRNA